LLKSVPKVVESLAFGQFDSCVVDDQGSCESVELSELIGSVNSNIFGVAFFEECYSFFDSCAFLDQSFFSADFFDLLGFEIILGFEFSDLCEFFIDVSDFFGEHLEEGFILLVYDLCSVFGILLRLWLFTHYLKILKY